MSVTTPLLELDDRFARELGTELALPWKAARFPDPQLVVFDEAVARDLGADPEALRAPEGVALLSGQAVPEGLTTVAMGYAGHQFGNWSPRLGDGRALLLGEVLDAQGRRRDVHLKGSGRTPFARGGDGKAAIGPMLREHLVSEAMHALGIPTTRALAVLTTGEDVARETLLPGGLLVRVAASHLRVGTFQYARSLGDRALLQRLLDHAIERHHPEAAGADVPALALFEAVLEAQAALVARWMGVGFVHGVMNTDNVTISGETIDYGPCAFMDVFDPKTVFSSIDTGGRYAFGNQPHVMQWDLARLAEALLPLAGEDTDAAVAAFTGALETFPERFTGHWRAELRRKTGLLEARPEDGELLDDLLRLLHEQGADWTGAFRALSAAARGDDEPARAELTDPRTFAGWGERWRMRLADEGRDPAAAAAAMDAANPVHVPRNHLVDDALAHATAGDMGPYEALLDRVTRPYAARPGDEPYARPAPATDGPFVTYCGT